MALKCYTLKGTKSGKQYTTCNDDIKENKISKGEKKFGKLPKDKKSLKGLKMETDKLKKMVSKKPQVKPKIKITSSNFTSVNKLGKSLKKDKSGFKSVKSIKKSDTIQNKTKQKVPKKCDLEKDKDETTAPANKIKRAQELSKIFSSSTPNGKYNYLIFDSNPNEIIILSTEYDKKNGRVLPRAVRLGHSELGGNKNVVAAGEMIVKDNSISIDNNSGHYKTDIHCVDYVVYLLEEKFKYKKEKQKITQFKNKSKIKVNLKK